MNWSSTLTDLIHYILDFSWQSLVFSANFIQLHDSLIISRLHTEKFWWCISGFLLSIVKVHTNAVNLSFPFSNNAIKLFCLLLHRGIENLSLIKLACHWLKFWRQLGLGLFHLSQFCLQLVSCWFCFRKTSLHFQFSHFKFFSLCNSFLFIALPHQISFTDSFAQLSSNILLWAHLLIEMILHSCNIMLSIPELAKKWLTLLGFIISNGTGLSQLISKRQFQLCEHIGRVFKLLQWAKKICIFSSKLPFSWFYVSQCKVGFFYLFTKLIKSGLEIPERFFRWCLWPGYFISSCSCVSNFMHNHCFVLFNLGLDLVQLLDLFLHLGIGILLLLFQSNNGWFLLNLGFFKVSADFCNLSLPFLVEFDLSTCCSRSFRKAFIKVFHFSW